MSTPSNAKATIVLDVSAYHDPAIIEAFYLDKLRSGNVMPLPELRRYHLAHGRETADYEVLSPDNLEFPRINYPAVNAGPYQYVYGAGTRLEGNFIDELVKVDLRNRTSQLWYEDGCYPGEPVFVAVPGAAHEDQGLILAVVLDGVSGSSFLLVLDATSFTELGRAMLPHHIPFGFHGQYLTGAEREPHLHR
jgi:beta,beta-carotene 9',10'-dioxygenase